MEVLDNIANLQSEVQSRANELTRIREEMVERLAKKQAAIDEMFEANEKGKTKVKEIRGRVDSLERIIQAKEKELVEQKTLTEKLTLQIQKLRSDHAQTTSDLTQAQRDIDSLQGNLKEKDAIIEKMKSAGSELKRALSTAKEKVKGLEDEKSSLKKSDKAKELRLNMLEGFAAALHDGDEDKL
jgi:chromosome segregation ATPase